MVAADIIAALRRRHSDEHQWAFFAELRVGTAGISESGDIRCVKKGRRGRHWASKWDQRIDVWVMNLWRCHRFERISYEIKVSRGDFLRELADPTKHRAAMELSNRFYFAAPPGLIAPKELPPDCGLIQVHYNGEAKIKHQAPWRDTPAPEWRFVASLARRVQKAEREAA